MGWYLIDSGFFDFFFIIIFFIVAGIIVVTVISQLFEWNDNNHSPKLDVEATVKAKRMSISHHHTGDNTNMMMHTTTNYYVTFEVESGDRMEFGLSDREYAQLSEGDKGKLSFQGTRYLGFLRR